MNVHARHFEEAATGQLHNIVASSEEIGRKVTSLFDDNLDYSKQTLEDTAAFIKGIFEQPTLRDTLQLQTEFARSQSVAFIEQFRKVAGIYQDIAVEAINPIRSAVARVDAAANR